MSKKVWILLLAAAAILAAGWFARQHFTSKKSTGAEARAGRGNRQGGGGGRSRGAESDLPVPVTAGTVEAKDVPIFLDGLGTVQAFNTVTMKARVDGTLDKIVFKEGQNVRAGDLLAEIDPRPYQALLDEALAKKAQDEAQLASARSILTRNGELIGKKVIDQQSYDTQRFTVDQLAATVKADQAAVDNAQTQLNYTRITAPIDGRLGVRQVDQGNIIRAGDATGLVVITQLQPISVIFTLPEQYFQRIREHYPQNPEQNPMTVHVVGRDNSEPLAEGKLAVIDNQIDPASATIRLKATVPNDDERLWPGEFVNVRLLLTTRQGGLVVPASVVQRGPQGSYAFVIKQDQTVEIRLIKVAQVEAGQALINEGLQAGESVVVDGQYKLQPGARVEISVPGKREGRRKAAAAAPSTR